MAAIRIDIKSASLLVAMGRDGQSPQQAKIAKVGKPSARLNLSAQILTN